MDHPEYGDSRFRSMIDMFGLGSNFVDCAEEAYDKRFEYGINYEDFERKLSKVKEGNLTTIEKVLCDALSNNKESHHYKEIIREMYEAGLKGI